MPIANMALFSSAKQRWLNTIVAMPSTATVVALAWPGHFSTPSPVLYRLAINPVGKTHTHTSHITNLECVPVYFVNNASLSSVRRIHRRTGTSSPTRLDEECGLSCEELQTYSRLFIVGDASYWSPTSDRDNNDKRVIMSAVGTVSDGMYEH